MQVHLGAEKDQQELCQDSSYFNVCFKGCWMCPNVSFVLFLHFS